MGFRNLQGNILFSSMPLQNSILTLTIDFPIIFFTIILSKKPRMANHLLWAGVETMFKTLSKLVQCWNTLCFINELLKKMILH